MTCVSVRNELLDLLPAVGSRFGLSRTMIDHLRYLIRWTKELDWLPGNRAVVYCSVTTLARELGISERQIHNREQLIASALELPMSPTGSRRRYGRRDPEDGRILQACGFELTALRGLLPAWRALKAEADAEHAQWRALRRVLSEVRSEIQGLVNALLAAGDLGALDGIAADLMQVRRRVLTQTPLADLERRLVLAEGIRARLAALVGAVESCGPRGETSAMAEENFRPTDPPTDPPTGDPSPACRPAGNNPPAVARRRAADLAWQGTARGGLISRDETGAGRVGVRLALRAASDEFRAMVRRTLPPGAIKPAGEAEVIAAARACLAELGIAPAVWHEAVALVGPWPAALCVLLTERAASRKGLVSPGGYLRTMARRGLGGGLHLDRSIFAMARAA